MELLTVAEVARRLKISTVRMYQLVKVGRITAHKLDGRLMIAKDDANRFQRWPAGRPRKNAVKAVNNG